MKQKVCKKRVWLLVFFWKGVVVGVRLMMSRAEARNEQKVWEEIVPYDLRLQVPK